MKRSPKHYSEGTNHLNALITGSLGLLKTDTNFNSTLSECHSGWPECHTSWKTCPMLLSAYRKGICRYTRHPTSSAAGFCRDHIFCVFLSATEKWASKFFAWPQIFLHLPLSEMKVNYPGLWVQGGQMVKNYDHVLQVLVQESRQVL